MVDDKNFDNQIIKLLGSGGAIVGLQLDNEKFEIMRNDLQQSIGCIVVDIIPNLTTE